MGGWRVSRGRGVLRPVGLPYHLAAPVRVGEIVGDLARSVLGPARAAAVAGAVLPGGGDRALLRGGGVGAGDSGPEGRWDLGADLLQQLASDRGRDELLRGHGTGVAARAHVVARDRGAVLPRMADRARRGAVARESRQRRPRGPRHRPGDRRPWGREPPAAARPLRRNRHGRDRLGGRHSNPVRGRPQSGSRLLRDRHQGGEPADRGLAGDRLRAVARRPRPRRRRSSTAAAGRRCRRLARARRRSRRDRDGSRERAVALSLWAARPRRRGRTLDRRRGGVPGFARRPTSGARTVARARGRSPTGCTCGTSRCSCG